MTMKTCGKRISKRSTWIGPNISICSARSEEHTSELQSQSNLVCRLLLEKKKDVPYAHPPDPKRGRPLHELAGDHRLGQPLLRGRRQGHVVLLPRLERRRRYPPLRPPDLD